jgi:hypothetical protein
VNERSPASHDSPSLASVEGDGAVWPPVEQEVSCLFQAPQAPRLVGSAGSIGHFSWLLLFGPAKRSSSLAGRPAKARRRRAISRPHTMKCAAPNNTPKRPIQTRLSGTNSGQRHGQEAGHRMSHQFRVVRPTRRPRTDALQGLIAFGRTAVRGSQQPKGWSSGNPMESVLVRSIPNHLVSPVLRHGRRTL